MAWTLGCRACAPLRCASVSTGSWTVDLGALFPRGGPVQDPGLAATLVWKWCASPPEKGAEEEEEEEERGPAPAFPCPWPEEGARTAAAVEEDEP